MNEKPTRADYFANIVLCNDLNQQRREMLQQAFGRLSLLLFGKYLKANFECWAGGHLDYHLKLHWLFTFGRILVKGG